MDPFLKVALSASAKPTTKVACFPSNDHNWLDKFKGTPLMQQAIALEQQDIQNEIAEKQYQEQNRSMSRSFWHNRDQIQLQKRMLELQLAQEQMGVMDAPAMTEPPVGPDAAAAGGGEMAPTPETAMKTAARGDYPTWVYGAVPGFFGGGGLGAIPGGLMSQQGGELAKSVGVDPIVGAKRSALGQMAGGLVGETGGFLAGSAMGLNPSQAYALATLSGLGGAVTGHHMAMRKYRDQAEVQQKQASVLAAGDMVGRAFTKVALGVPDLKNLVSGAVNWAKANPRAAAAIGTGAVGAGYGALTAKGENGHSATLGQRLGRAAGFGALGAGVGAAGAQAGLMGRDMAQLRSTGTGWGEAAKQVAGQHLRGAGMQLQNMAAPAGAVPTAGTLRDGLHSLGSKLQGYGSALG